MTDRWAAASSSAGTAGGGTTRGRVSPWQPCPQVEPHRVSWWRRRRLSGGGGTEHPSSSSRSRPNVVLSVRFLWRETAAACTCGVLGVGRSGAGSVAWPGTQNVWETTGSGRQEVA